MIRIFVIMASVLGAASVLSLFGFVQTSEWQAAVGAAVMACASVFLLVMSSIQENGEES